MTLPSAYNTITMAQVNTELGRASNAAISLTETAVRTLAGVPSGIITMHDLPGKSAATLGFNSGAALSIYCNEWAYGGAITVTSSGTLVAVTGGSGPTAYLSPTGAGNGANYEALIYHSSSTGGRSMYGPDLVPVYQGSYSAWYSLDASRSFEGANEEAYDVYSYGTLFIRRKDLSASISVNFTIESYRTWTP